MRKGHLPLLLPPPPPPRDAPWRLLRPDMAAAARNPEEEEENAMMMTIMGGAQSPIGWWCDRSKACEMSCCLTSSGSVAVTRGVRFECLTTSSVTDFEIDDLNMLAC